MHSITVLAIFAALLVAPIPTQNNLLTNPGFESGLSGWLTRGSPFHLAVETLDCDGDGAASKCLSITPDDGSKVITISQRTLLDPKKEYWLRFSVRGTGQLTRGNASNIQVHVGGNDYGGTAAHAGDRTRLTEWGGFVGTRVHQAEVQLTIFTNWHVPTGFKVHIDNIELYELRQIPWLTCYSDRANQPAQFDVFARGRPGAQYRIYLGTKRLTPPVASPGLGGMLELDPAGGIFLVASGVLDSTNGSHSQSLPIPASALNLVRGKPLLFVPFSIDPATSSVDLGKVTVWGIL